VDGGGANRIRGDEPTVRDLVDVALGAGVAATRLGAGVARPFVSTAARAVRLGMWMAHDRPPARLAHRLADRGAAVREGLLRAAAEVVRSLLPLAVEKALGVIDVTDLVRAHVDLDAVAKALDVDAVVARVDLDAAVSRVDLDRVAARLDVDAVIARADLDRVVSRIDVDAIIAEADLDRIVSRIDVDAIIAEADLDRIVSRIDVDAIIAEADLDRIASRIDVESIVRRVDPDEVVARVDVEAVLDRLDLTAIARQVIEGLDLAPLLHEASSAASSQVARSVRTEGMNADETVARFFDRLLRRNHADGAVTP
jgi:hypothetical protein